MKCRSEKGRRRSEGIVETHVFHANILELRSRVMSMLGWRSKHSVFTLRSLRVGNTGSKQHKLAKSTGMCPVQVSNECTYCMITKDIIKKRIRVQGHTTKAHQKNEVTSTPCDPCLLGHFVLYISRDMIIWPAGASQLAFIDIQVEIRSNNVKF